MKPRGTTWMISRSLGTETARAASITRLTSSCPISRSERATAIMPRLFWLRTCVPAMPTKADSTLWPHIRCAASTAWLMPLTVFSMLTTTPRRRPSEDASPKPTMLRPRSVGSPTTQQILVVPISSAVTYLERGKNLSWNVGWNWQAHYGVVPPPKQHNRLRVIHRFFVVLLEQMPPDDCQVVKDSHTEGDDRGEIQLDAELVAQVGQRTRRERVDEQPGDEDFVLEVSVQPGFDRSQHGVERGEDHDGGVARVACRDLQRRIEPQHDTDRAEDEDRRHQPERLARSPRRKPHLWARICTAGARAFSRLMYWIGAETRSIRLLSARSAASFGSRLARSSLATICPKMIVHPRSVWAVRTSRVSSRNDVTEILKAELKPVRSWISIGRRSLSTARRPSLAGPNSGRLMTIRLFASTAGSRTSPRSLR